jgi:hypothetical protein
MSSEGIEIAASVVEPKHLYYYKVDACKAADAMDRKCICWHQQGTGPFKTAAPDDADTFLAWRTEGSNAQRRD